MSSASTAMLLCEMFVVLSAVPSQQKGRCGGISSRLCFVAAHDPGAPLQPRLHQCHRSTCQRRRCRRSHRESSHLAAFAVLPREAWEPGFTRCRSVAGISPRFPGRRRHSSSSSSRHRPFHSTWLTASASPGDESNTPQVLSPAEILEFVRRVELFDLPPGGLTAGEVGYPRALPLQVLECIRHRHGLQDFAGGRLLLDPEYECYEVAAGAASAPEDNEGKGLLFPGLRLLHAEPILIGVDDFFSSDECDEYISKSVSPPLREYVSRAGMGPFEQPAALDSGQHTSTTFIHQFVEVPELMAKASALMGVVFADGQWEEAQTVRYRPGEQFSWHLDAMSPTPEMESQGGQRIANLLVYLNDLPEDDGGATVFKNLGLRVRPRKGSALVFFPSFGGVPGCPLDPLLLHAGEVLRPGAGQDKWIAQLRLREGRTTPMLKDNQHAQAEPAVEEFDDFWRGSFFL